MGNFQRKTFRSACLPLLICSWINGSVIIEYPIGRQRIIWSNLIACFNLFFYGLNCYWNFSLNISVASNVLNIKRIGHHIMNFVNTILCVYSGILSLRNRKAPERFISRIQIIDNTLEKFGVTKNYQAVYISNLYKVLQMFIVVETVNVINITALLQKDIDLRILILALITHQLNLIMYISDMGINVTVKYVGKKFKQLNDILEGYANNELYVTEAERRQAFDRRTSSKIHRVIKTAKETHLELTRVSQGINAIHGFQMLLSVSLSFLGITWILYYAFVQMLQHKIDMTDISDINVLQIMSWFIFYSIKITMIVQPCAEATKEARRTDDIIYRLGDTSRDHMIRKEVQDFFLQIVQHPVAFSANGFVNLDYTLIRGMIGTVTTYLVIFIQVDDIQPTDSLSTEALNISV